MNSALPVYVNKQRAYTNEYGSTLRITAIQDEDYVISIESESGAYANMYVPGSVLEGIVMAFINEPKSALAERPKEWPEIDIWDQIRSNDVNKSRFMDIINANEALSKEE